LFLGGIFERFFGLQLVPALHQIRDKFRPVHGFDSFWVIRPAILPVMEKDEASGFIDSGNLEFGARSLIAAAIMGHMVHILIKPRFFLNDTTTPFPYDDRNMTEAHKKPRQRAGFSRLIGERLGSQSRRIG
jgi:hypothetical protein